MTTPLIEIHNLTKSFGATRALDGVSLQVNPGEVVALLGHNGSGKSTLVKILSDVQPADSGTIDTYNTTVHVIHQSLGLINSLSAIENIDLARPSGARLLAPFRRKTETQRVEALIARFGTELDPTVAVAKLTPAQRTVVAIVRALDGWAEGDHVLVLDEPTATLHDEETTVLLDAVRRIAAEGVGIIYISHRLNEVMELADRAVVLRNGQVVAEHTRGNYQQEDLLKVIAGESNSTTQHDRTQTFDKTALKVTGLSGHGISDVSLEVHAGEVLGVAGVIGSGMEQLNALIFGATAATDGELIVADQAVPLANPRESVAAGVGYLPPDRLVTGGIAIHSVRENITLPKLKPLRRWHGAIAVQKEVDEAEQWMDRVRALPTRASHQELRALSGGNQQKVLLAKWLRLTPKVLLLDEPTQGVDVGAQAEIHSLIRAAAASGAAAVIASSDTHELIEACDRIIVMQNGKIADELTADRLTETELVHAVLQGPELTSTGEH